MNAKFGSWYSDELIRKYFWIGLSSAGLVAVSLLWQVRAGFQLADEGFLWYGAQRVMQGEVPVRDFMSYDIGRYYWSAALMFLQGDDGIIALRIAVGVFQAAGLFAGLTVLTRTPDKPRSLPWLLLATVVLLVWMYPRHKLFDVSISIGLIALLTFLAERPTTSRYFIAGIGVGLAAVFGRNHGVYGVFGTLVVMAYLLSRRQKGPSTPRALGSWAGGIVVGYLPMLPMLIFCPGFGHAFWEGIRYLFEIKATNLSLPIPLPWRVAFGQLSIVDSVRGVFVGLLFIGTLAFGLAGIARTMWHVWRNESVSPPLLACIGLALPYAHYAYSRADIGHLALGIFPMLLGSLVWLSDLRNKWIRWSIGGLFCAVSLFVMLPLHPGWQSRTHENWRRVLIGHEAVLVDPVTARDAALLQLLTHRFAVNSRGSFLAIPFWPGAYALMNRKSPTWEIYPLYRRSESLQREEIRRIESAAPSFVIIVNLALDNREELRFANTHPFLNRYLQTHFRPTADVVAPKYYQVLLPRSSAN